MRQLSIIFTLGLSLVASAPFHGEARAQKALTDEAAQILPDSAALGPYLDPNGGP